MEELPDSIESEYLYHGSSHLIKTLEPRPSKVLNGDEAVFATQSKILAIIFAPEWNDADLGLGVHGGKLYIVEHYPDALDLLRAKNKRGYGAYLYTVSSKGFTSDPRLGMKNHEFINKKSVEILDTVIINDVLEYIQNLDEEIAIITHDQAFEAFEKAGLI